MNSTKTGAYKEFIQMMLLQVYFTYVQALPLIIVSAFSVGLACAFQANLGLALLGQLENLGQILNTIIFREITPLIVTILIVIRSVTAITSEIAMMKVNREIEALEIMGISIENFLIRPRIVAGSISFFCMAITFFAFCTLGFWLWLNNASGVHLSSLLHYFFITIRPTHVIFFTIKTLLIGAFIVYRACHHGMSLSKASFEVPIVTNKSVVECLILGVSLQVAVTSISYLLFDVGI
ncbi:hypothetical protein A9Q84_00575 [Halobacteriovorax marinus]|uniref:ABC transporter permease n=1 Tax=Halobacteriovorax marinus TaxID=97084 RepID=A0A1Y5FI72_9BACT|nr:hypothetical protein A9Q84_00575 [Halobacteriovorax marinus]